MNTSAFLKDVFDSIMLRSGLGEAMSLLFDIILRRPHVFWHPLIAHHISLQANANAAYFPLSLFICPSLCILAKVKDLHCIVRIIFWDKSIGLERSKMSPFLTTMTNLDFENLYPVLMGFLTNLS